MAIFYETVLIVVHVVDVTGVVGVTTEMGTLTLWLPLITAGDELVMVVMEWLFASISAISVMVGG
jgi:hypothetical protein